ncbi:MAG: hypothetical protein F4219_01935 [Gammaproteobacteria bacterium]|nr:hypothetical protein [Gammaproteobacteria bacterium]
MKTKTHTTSVALKLTNEDNAILERLAGALGAPKTRAIIEAVRNYDQVKSGAIIQLPADRVKSVKFRDSHTE